MASFIAGVYYNLGTQDDQENGVAVRDRVGTATANITYSCGIVCTPSEDEQEPEAPTMEGAPTSYTITQIWHTYSFSTNDITTYWRLPDGTQTPAVTGPSGGTYHFTNLSSGTKYEGLESRINLIISGTEHITTYTRTTTFYPSGQDPDTGEWNGTVQTSTSQVSSTQTVGGDVILPTTSIVFWTRPGLFTDYDMVKDAQGRFPVIEQFLDLTKIENWVSHCRDYYEWYYQEEAGDTYENVLSQALPSSIYVTKAWFNNCVSCCANVDTRPYSVTSQNNDDVIRAALFARQIIDNTTTPPTISYPSRSLGGTISDATEV